MSDIDISREAVESWCDSRGVLLTKPPRAPQEVEMLRALLDERDSLKARHGETKVALQNRVDRLEAALREFPHHKKLSDHIRERTKALQEPLIIVSQASCAQPGLQVTSAPDDIPEGVYLWEDGNE